MKLIVKRYDAVENVHECIDEKGKKHKVDLQVDGGLGKIAYTEEIIGKTIECGYLSPYIEIANSVRLFDKEAK